MIHSIRTTFTAAALAVLPLAAQAEFGPLVEPAELRAALDDGAPVVLDIRGEGAYEKGHVPGALNAPYGLFRGPSDNPGELVSEAHLTEVLRGLGIDAGDQVVVVHQGSNQTDFGAAARVYWTLKSAGLDRIAILNGGVRGWVAADRDLSVEPARAEPSKATFTLSNDWMVSRDGVGAILSGDRQATLLDARPDAFRTGEKKHPAAKKAGTLPGSEQVRYDNWFTGSGAEIAIADRVKALADEARPGTGEETVSFCNTGHWAAINWFALSEMAGRENVKLYPESMVGWANSGGAVDTVE